jgi:SAM-dependent methyltransferase
MATVTKPLTVYVLGRTFAEHQRLLRQGRLISKITQHFIEEIGLVEGMRVLDVGSGVGDLSLLAAKAVGNSGQVVCVDRDSSALALAKQGANHEAVGNIVLHQCDFHRYPGSVSYDAVIGRCVLLHQHDPVASVKAILKHVRSNGIVAFQEPWFSRAFSYPEAPLFEAIIGWLHETVRRSGLDGDIGVRLPSVFEAAGLPRPKLMFEMLVDCGGESEVYDFCTDTVRSLLPRIEELGISSADEIQLDTLAERLRNEAWRLGTVIGLMPLMGTWSYKQ